MNLKEVLGIDVSKLTLDCYLHSNGVHKIFDNNSKGIAIQEGKNKMSTLNIIRNKLLARAFAVVHRQTPYVDTMRYAS